MTAAYWEFGRRIVQSEQAGEKRAEYGELLIKRLAKDPTASFGRGFGPRNLAQMRSFYLSWPQGEILQTPSAKSPVPILINDKSGNFSTIPSVTSSHCPGRLRPAAFCKESEGANFLRDRGSTFRLVCPAIGPSDRQSIL
jgi:hypothetical protein